MKNLIKNLENLTDGILKVYDVYKFNTSQLPDIDNYQVNIRENNVFEDIFKALDKKLNHCLYWFSLPSIEKANGLNNLLNMKRSELYNNLRVVPPKGKYSNSNTFYVGIRRGGIRKSDGLSNISGRIIQHLGYYPKGSTQGLQFAHWSKGSDYDIELNVIEFKDLPDEYLNIIESLVAYKLKPLTGKH